jgi:hypothetical protein
LPIDIRELDLLGEGLVAHVVSIPFGGAWLVIDGVANEIGGGAIIGDLRDDWFGATAISESYPTRGYADRIEIVVAASDQVPEVRCEAVANVDFVNVSAVEQVVRL